MNDSAARSGWLDRTGTGRCRRGPGFWCRPCPPTRLCLWMGAGWGPLLLPTRLRAWPPACACNGPGTVPSTRPWRSPRDAGDGGGGPKTFTGRSTTIMLRPSFERKTHVIDVRASESESLENTLHHLFRDRIGLRPRDTVRKRNSEAGKGRVAYSLRCRERLPLADRPLVIVSL